MVFGNLRIIQMGSTFNTHLDFSEPIRSLEESCLLLLLACDLPGIVEGRKSVQLALSWVH